MRCLMCLLVIVVSFDHLRADTLRVPDDHATIQEAIDAAMQLDVIEVAPGRYEESISYHAKLLTITSQNPDDPTVVASTIIAGVGPKTVIFSGIEDERASLVGLTIETQGAYGIYGEGCLAPIDRCSIIGGSDAGIYNVRGPITRCTVTGCGSGIKACNSTSISDCILMDNGYGIRECSTTEVERCRISDNATAGVYSTTGSLINCLVSANGGYGWYAGASSSIRNCTFVGNGNRGVSATTSSVTVTNCILWDNGQFGAGNPTMTYSAIQGGHAGIGNIDQNPLFMTPGYWKGNNWTEGDYRLPAVSPCVGAGDPSFVSEELDHEGNPRVVGARVDIGAYEYADCTDGADFDGDGTPDVCDADVDGDGVPNAADLCDYTPAGASVEPDGTLAVDADGDCDVDLADFQIMQLRMTGPMD